MNRLRSASRYATTYLVLLQQFAAERGWRFGVLLLAVLANAFVHPIPFLLIAEILRSTQAGADKIALGWGGLSFSVQPDLGVLAVFLIGAGSFLLSYGVSRLVGREIVAWQSAMFWRLLGQAGRLARWDRTFELGAILQPHPIAAKLDGALRGAFPIGRLIETGSRDFVMILVLGAMLVWQDPRDTLVLGLLSLLFLPAYAIALSRLVKMQSKSNAQHGRLLRPVAEILSSDITRRSGQRLDTKTMPSSATSALARGFGSQSHLLNEQNAVTVVAGVHVFAAFYGVYLSEGQSLATLPAAKLSSLFFLVLLLRSLTGLIGLISRLSRGYERLGQLRALLFPAAKPQVAADQQRLGQFNFSGSFESYSGAMPAGLGPGQCLLYLAPDISYEFQLLPLSNALCPSFAPTPTITRHIPLIGVDEVPALLALADAKLMRCANPAGSRGRPPRRRARPPPASRSPPGPAPRAGERPRPRAAASARAAGGTNPQTSPASATVRSADRATGTLPRADTRRSAARGPGRSRGRGP